MSIKMKKSKNVSSILKNLSNENKLLILCFIGKDKKNVTDILSSVSISQSQVSQYL
jgi:DNA-binding transcriptional ArsR family regulator